MRYLFGFMCVLALGAMGCAVSADTDGSGGGSGCTPGSEGCACNEGRCLTDLQCLSNLCVDPAGPGGTGGNGDGGTAGNGGGGTGGTGGVGGGPVCGNNVAEPPEVCDGTDLGFATGATCADVGFTGGTLACNASCDNLDLTGCTGGPAGWTCPPDFYGTADGCDCGCGVIDPDCADGTVASCEFCGEVGSCSPLDSGCPGDIDPTQNWLCGG
jgi:hypothetical protein